MGKIDFNFFGIKLTDSPNFDINIFSSEPGKGFELSWIIPLIKTKKGGSTQHNLPCTATF